MTSNLKNKNIFFYSKGVIMMLRAMPIHEEFRADHAFLYYIKDTLTNSVIFSGRNKNLKKL